jgi:Lrp/AsnC family leucine-responsive transcriptional regulator
MHDLLLLCSTGVLRRSFAISSEFSWNFVITWLDVCAKVLFIRRIVREMELDSIDRRILEVLQKKGRISNADLSEMANLSASACHRRVQRLEKDGYIRDYVALLDPRKVGRPTTVFVEITLSGQADEVLDAFERAVARVPDVLECHLMAGTADYLLKVVAGDTEDFARIHRRYLATLPGVAQMQSSFALRTVRQTTAMPV